MSKKIVTIGVTLVVVAVLVLVALGIWLGSLIMGGDKSDAAAPSQYSVVSLATGEMYFGKLSWFPSPHLSKVWTLQRQVDKDNQTQMSLAEYGKAFWGPVDDLSINPKEIVWWSRLRNDSQIAKAIDNPSLLQQQQQQAPASGNGASGSSNFRGPSTPPPATK